MTIKEKVLKIMSLALEINPPEIKGIGKKRTAVFVNYSPNCNSLTVEIYPYGWSKDIPLRRQNRFTVYLFRKGASGILDRIISGLEDLKNCLAAENSDADDVSDLDTETELVESSESLKVIDITHEELKFIDNLIVKEIKHLRDHRNFFDSCLFSDCVDDSVSKYSSLLYRLKDAADFRQFI